MNTPQDSRVRTAQPAPAAGARVLMVLIRGYQLVISPWLGPSCRYQPTCSEYARQSLAAHGLRRGTYYALRRILRCHPWGGSGYDPIPERGDRREPAQRDSQPRPPAGE